MCGIAGFQGRFDEALLDAMNHAVAHRGPDGQGAWLSEAAADGALTGLAHRRLAIIDLSAAAAQPMTVHCEACGAHGLSDLALTFNGEIYNYRELRAGLERAGHRFRSASDAEVLLHAYGAEGSAALARLNGIFAFAVREGRERGRPEGVGRGDVLLARDPIGVKPLYLGQSPRGIVFASEIKAVLQEPSVPRDLDSAAIHQTIAYLWTPAPRTVLASVTKLEPGQACWLRAGRVHRTWSHFVPGYDGSTSGASRAELGVELAERVRTAVERQLVSDVPVGAFLSGGLDSSAVVAMMRRARPDERFPCFTIALRDARALGDHVDDLPFARAAAAHLGVDLVEVDVEPNDVSRLEEMVCWLDEPQADPAPLNALMISERARDMGIKVLLSGAGGDDLFGGYRRHWAVRAERFWRWLPRRARAALRGAADSAASGAWKGQSLTPLRRAAKMLAYADLPDDRRLVSYFWWSTPSVRRALYSPAFAEQVSGVDEAAPLLRTLASFPKEHDALQRMLVLELRHFLADHNLNYTDRAGMAAGVEIRVPLVDVDVVELATRIPAGLKQRGRVGKALFKESMAPYLPPDVVHRPKSGFGVPLRHWLRRDLRRMVADVLSPDALRRRGLFDPVAVERLVARDRDGAIDGSYTIFSLMCLELWFRNFVDRPAVEVGRRPSRASRPDPVG